MKKIGLTMSMHYIPICYSILIASSTDKSNKISKIMLHNNSPCKCFGSMAIHFLHSGHFLLGFQYLNLVLFCGTSFDWSQFVDGCPST